MNTLVIDIGGTNVKIWKTGEGDCEKIRSGKSFTPRRLMESVEAVAEEWEFERVSIGYPGEVQHGRPVTEPLNLGPGWLEFDWSAAFPCPMRLMNDACMQALGSYEGGRMLYLGLGTGVGTAFIIDGKIVPLALGHLPFEGGKELDALLNREGLKERGPEAWRQSIIDTGTALKAAFHADYVVLGGGNAKKLHGLPEGFRKGGNHNAYFGGLRMWEDALHLEAPPRISLPA